MKNQPSLKGLRAFEAAARTGSFSAAAKELSVSPAAIGQLVRSLETQIGKTLFHRVHRRIVTTEAGLEVLPRLQAVFEELNIIANDISGSGRRARLTISAPASVLSGWLSQKIGEFIDIYDQRNISLRSDMDPVNFERDSIDIRISFGRFHYRTHDTVEISNDTVYPVCSPGFLEKHGPFGSANSVLDAPLVHTDWGAASATFASWHNWADAANVTLDNQMNIGLIADNSQVAINLALAGLGITLAQGLVAAQHFDSGKLIIAHEISVKQSQPYCLTIPQQSAARPAVILFRNWLLSEIGSIAI